MNETLKKRLQILKLQIEIGDIDEAHSTLERTYAAHPQPAVTDKLMAISALLEAKNADKATALVDELSAGL